MEQVPQPKRKHLSRIPVWLPQEMTAVYFVTVCCDQRRPVFNQAVAARMAVDCLSRTASNLNWEVSKVCIMPDHIHLLMSPLTDRDQSVSSFMQRWKSCVTLRLKGKIDGPIWQKEFFDHLLRSEEKWEEKWEYIRANPVRAGLCAHPEDYPYSGTPVEIMSKLKIL